MFFCLSLSVTLKWIILLFLIQIGLKAEWRAHQGRLIIFLGNKGTSPLTSVKALVLPPSHLKMELSLIPDSIPPRAQVNKLIQTDMSLYSCLILNLIILISLFRFNVHLRL